MKIYSNGEMLQVGGGAQEVYSTEETRIGTWIDGKPLYRRVLRFTTGKENSWTHVQLGVVVDHACGIGYIIRNDDTKVLGKCMIPNKWTEVQFNRVDVGIVPGVAHLANSPGIIIMQYTKTTDEATVELPAALTVSMPNFAATHQSAASVVLDPGIKDGEV